MTDPTITGLTADRMLAMEAATVVGGHVVGDELILSTRDGNTIDAGNVRGPKGDTGPASIGLMAWPVGSIFMAVVSTNPATLLGGGTWVAWGTGRVPVAIDTGQVEFDTVEETGGEKTHTLTATEMPVHTHLQNAHTHADNFSLANAGGHRHNLHYTRYGQSPASYGVAGLDSSSDDVASSPVDVAGDHTHTVNGAVSNATAVNQNAGGGGAHNNLQPSITCYMWKRTA